MWWFNEIYSTDICHFLSVKEHIFDELKLYYSGTSKAMAMVLF